jgi:hypothetical protein
VVFGNPLPGIQSVKHGGNLYYPDHALMRCMERGFSIERIKDVLDSSKAEVLENTPSIGGASPRCLILGFDQIGKACHVVVAYPVGVVVTAYEPTLPKWADYRTRGSH